MGGSSLISVDEEQRTCFEPRVVDAYMISCMASQSSEFYLQRIEVVDLSFRALCRLPLASRVSLAR